MKKMLAVLLVFCLVSPLLSAQKTYSGGRGNSRNFEKPNWIHDGGAVSRDVAVVTDASCASVSTFSKETASNCEKYSVKYVLSYQAYLTARSQKEVNEYLVDFLRNYREAYAEYLKEMRELDLANADQPQNPAGDFNDRQSDDGQRLWVSGDIKNKCKTIAALVNSGAKPDEVKKKIEALLPSKASSYAPEDEPDKCEACREYKMVATSSCDVIPDGADVVSGCPGIHHLYVDCKDRSDMDFDPAAATCPCCASHPICKECAARLAAEAAEAAASGGDGPGGIPLPGV